jgi:hypothetical protein
MRSRCVAAAAFLSLGVCVASSAASSVAVEGLVEATPRVTQVPRIGVNLGHWTYWGAEQLSRNILKNPGFEGLIDRALVRVSYADRNRFNDDQTWLSRPDGFWSGATYEILTGSQAGQGGTLADSRESGRNGLPELITADRRALLGVGDIVALTRIRDDLAPQHWWLPTDSTAGRVYPDSSVTAPGSPGRRALALHPLSSSTVRIASHLDTITARAGKLLPVEGPWTLALWLRGPDGTPPRVRIVFRRHGSKPFVDLTLSPRPGWQQIEHAFTATDQGPAGALEFAIEVSGGGPVHVDDVWLGSLTAMGDAGERSDGSSGRASDAFRPEVVAALQQLKPGYLRDWQGQLGDTFENRVADPRARRASRYRPGSGTDYGYGLDEVLDLSRAVGANPWLVIPTTLSTDEARRLGTWLADRIRSDGFNEVLIEFGNENWNSVFRPAGIQDPTHHGQAADRAFAALRQGAKNHEALRFVVNAQHANPYMAHKVSAGSAQAGIVAVAPYLLSTLDSQDAVLERLFEGDGGRLAEIAGALQPGRELAIYEVNLHTTRGNVLASERDAVTTGAASGPALAKRLLEAMALGARRQAVYSLSGFDTPMEGSNAGLVRLFGITRDLTRADALRPTGWATAMLNWVVVGDLHDVQLVGGDDPKGLLIAPFRGSAAWSVAVVSAAPEPRDLTLRFADLGLALPASAAVLDATDPFKTNERADEVRPRAMAVEAAAPNGVRIRVPAYSLVVLGPAGVFP